MSAENLNPEQEANNTDRGDDVQLRFHYQAQRIAVLSLSLIKDEPPFSRVFCEFYDDALLKHFDKTYTAYQIKTKERGQPKFRATEKTILKSIRNFVRLKRKFGARMRRFVIASNHPFVSDDSKNDMGLISHQSKNPGTTNCELREFLIVFAREYKGFQESEVTDVLKMLTIYDEEPDFNAAFSAVVDELRKLPDYKDVGDNRLSACARALISKVESSSRKSVVPTSMSSDEDAEQIELYKQSVIKTKMILPSTVRKTLQSALGQPLGTFYKNVLPQSISPDMNLEIKNALALSGETLLCTKRILEDGSKFARPELDVVLKELKEFNTLLLLGEPGSGKSALLAELCERLRKDNQHVLVIKCEELPKGSCDQIKLAEHLNIPYTAAQCLSSIAVTEPVFLLIDQIDAIGSLWDSQTSRMQTVLGLVHTIKSVPNVRIVISCREFDANFDVRISGLKAREITLQLPAKEEIAKVLSNHGVQCSGWPDDIIILLRNPQHLDIFIDLLKDAAGQVQTVTTYMDLLGLLWSKRVAPVDDKFLSLICENINSRNQLFIPLADVFTERTSIDRLSGAGILKFINNGNNVGFAHQTLFEYCLARSFSHRGHSFSEYVLVNQHSMHCRPLIWSCLHFLRNCDSVSYERELNKLLDNRVIRAHIKSLLIQFFSQARNLSTVELSLILPKIRKGFFSESDFLLLGGNGEWLDTILPSYLPTLMNNSATHEQAASFLLKSCKLREATVIGLLQKYWLSDFSCDKYSFAILKQVKNWTPYLRDVVIEMILRNNFDESLVELFILDISTNAPELAPKVVASWLEKHYLRVCQNPKENFDPPGDLLGVERFLWNHRATKDSPRLNEIIRIIEGRERFYLPTVATNACASFTSLVWPVFRKMLEETVRPRDDVRDIYLGDHAHCTGQKLKTICEERYSLVSIFAQILSTFAAADSDDFVNFVSQNADSESLTVHRLLCSGLIALAPVNPEFVLRYLLGSPKRLMLGSAYDPHSETKALIKLIAPLLALTLLRELESSILSWQLYVSTDVLNESEGRPKYQREHRLRLMMAIPEQNRSTHLSAIVESELALLPDYDNEAIPEPEVFMIKSPLTASQMNATSIEENQAIFDQINDECAVNPLDFKLGGTYELSQELEKLAQDDPYKALQIAASFQPNTHEIAVAHVLTGIGRSKKFSTRELEDSIRSFLDRGFNSNTFYDGMAIALDASLVASKIEMSQDIEKILIGALRRLPKTSVGAVKQSKDREESILWGGSHFQTSAMEGMRPILSALTLHYFAPRPPDTEKWLEVLFSAVKLRTDTLCWRSLALTDLWRLRELEYSSVKAFVQVLFESQPEVLTCAPGIYLVYLLLNILEPSYLSGLMALLKSSDWNLSNQAIGELSAVDFFVQGSAWSRMIVEESLSAEGDEKIAVGVAYTVGRAWQANDYRKKSVNVIKRLLEKGSERVSRALASKMNLQHINIADDETFWLIDLLCRHPALLRQGFAYIATSIPTLIIWDAERIYNLLEAFTNEIGADFTNHSLSFSYFAKSVVDATMTLQKIPNFETRALKLFERQMSLGMRETEEIIKAIDRLPALNDNKLAEI